MNHLSKDQWFPLLFRMVAKLYIISLRPTYCRAACAHGPPRCLTFQKRACHALQTDSLNSEVIVILEHYLQNAQSSVFVSVSNVKVWVHRDLEGAIERVSEYHIILKYYSLRNVSQRRQGFDSALPQTLPIMDMMMR